MAIAEDRRRLTTSPHGAEGGDWRRLRPARLRVLVLPGGSARPVQGNGGEQPPAHADPARAARHHLRPHRQAAGREPQLLQHLDRPRAHQGSRSHDPRAGHGRPASTRKSSARSSIAIAASRAIGRSSCCQDATLAQVAAVTARRLDFELPDVIVQEVPTRQYPDQDMAAHLIGYVGEASEDQMQADGVTTGSIVGQFGVERVYNKLLMGEDGAKRVVVNSVGREIRTLEEVPPVQGRRVQLTINYAMQKAAEDAFRAYGYYGSAVVLEPKTGEVLDADEHAGVRSQRLRDRHRSRDVGAAQHRQAAAAAESRHPGTLSAGIDVQDRRRDGGARRGRDHARATRSIARAAARSTAGSSSATSPAATATSTCATRSRSPATPTSTRSATCSASTRCTSGPRSSASRSRAASTCRTKSRASCPSTEWKQKRIQRALVSG